jgi:signal transduction histidine kinase
VGNSALWGELASWLGRRRAGDLRPLEASNYDRRGCGTYRNMGYIHRFLLGDASREWGSRVLGGHDPAKSAYRGAFPNSISGGGCSQRCSPFPRSFERWGRSTAYCILFLRNAKAGRPYTNFLETAGHFSAIPLPITKGTDENRNTDAFLFGRAGVRMMLPVERRTRRRLALLFCVPLAFSVAFFLIDVLSERTDTRLLEAHTLHSSISQLWSLAQDAESAERGFLLTGDPRELMPLQQAGAMLDVEINSCLRGAASETDLESKVVRLGRLLHEFFRETDSAIDIMRAQGQSAAVDALRARTGEHTIDEIHKTTIDLLYALDMKERSYLGREHRLNELSFGFFLGGSLITILVLAWLYRQLISYLEARDSAHAQLASLNSELEARIAERTRELQESNTELQQFAYVASHDLQEPLRTIVSFSQLLQQRYRGRLDEDADEFIDYIVTAARRMGDLINGLLALVRLRKPGQITVPVPFGDVVDEAEIALQASIRQSGARIEHGTLPSLAVDRVQFLQVLQNLISNAIKYRREESPSIYIEAHRDGSDWIFSVSDNGQGFNSQYAERIFGMFQRLHTRKVEGTGMGLSIAKKIVERHGGRMWATSVEGVGSTFYFSLPVSLEVSRPELSEAVEAVHASAPPSRGQVESSS